MATPISPLPHYAVKVVYGLGSRKEKEADGAGDGDVV